MLKKIGPATQCRLPTITELRRDQARRTALERALYEHTRPDRLPGHAALADEGGDDEQDEAREEFYFGTEG